MRRRCTQSFGRVLGVSLLAVIMLRAAEDRPNIVWLVSEDNSAEYLRLYDARGAAMPNVERLATQGLVFDHAFSNAPVCSVARSTLISGAYAPRLGAQFHRRLESVPMPVGLRMFSAYLREAGYYTTNNAKEDYNLRKGEGVWDASSREASYRHRAPGQPFFHVQNFGTTHEGTLHFDRKAMEAGTGEAEEVAPYLPDTALTRFTRAWYLSRHRELDAQIGIFLAQLEADGLGEDTIIFYFGDHGGALPRSKGTLFESGLRVPLVVFAPERWQHLFPAARGERLKGFVQFVDFAPTVLHLAGLPVPAAMDGVPFLGAGVHREELEAREVTFGYADRFDEKYDLVRSVRVGRFKYIRNFLPFNPDGLFNEYRFRQLAYREWRALEEAGKLDEDRAPFFRVKPAEALFDLEQDPSEIHNLATDPAQAEVLRRMRGELGDWMRSLPDLSLYPERFLLQHAMGDPVAFGQTHADEIVRLLEIADLSLQPFEAVESALAQALRSERPWKRYWAVIACAAHGAEASALEADIASLARGDPELLVRARAAEFLALRGRPEAAAILLACLRESDDSAGRLQILNTMAMLADTSSRYDFSAVRGMMEPEALEGRTNELAKRVRYLESRSRGRE